MKTPTDAIRDALEPMTVFNTKDQATLAVVKGLHDAGYIIIPVLPIDRTQLPKPTWRT